MNKIRIQKSPTADTRSCDPSTVTKEQLLSSSKQHIVDALLASQWLSEKMAMQVIGHDRDKIEDIDGFKRDFTGGDFKSRDWYQNHIRVNRHHLMEPDGIPEDVNLLDVLEHIIDCCVAGMARSGSVYPIEISDEVLQRAVQNTKELLIDNIEVSDTEDV